MDYFIILSDTDTNIKIKRGRQVGKLLQCMVNILHISKTFESKKVIRFPKPGRLLITNLNSLDF
jgi:hypothetical protein